MSVFSGSRKRKSGSFLALPHVVLENENFVNLSSGAVKLLIDISLQYRGCNNGDLCAAYSIMQKRGWKSKKMIAQSLKELLEKEFLILTRQGGRNQPTLYAIAWRPIDECNGKLDINKTKVAPKSFR